MSSETRGYVASVQLNNKKQGQTPLNCFNTFWEKIWSISERYVYRYI